MEFVLKLAYSKVIIGVCVFVVSREKIQVLSIFGIFGVFVCLHVVKCMCVKNIVNCGQVDFVCRFYGV